MGELEAIGDAVTGGMVGRAVEPKAGEGTDGHTHETNCLNCGATLTGPYCSQCGQHAHVHRTLSAFFDDFLHGVLHFEGKIWRTLPLLVWKPGELTRRYIDGQRSSFVSPIALFLFTVFLMFAVIHLVGALDFTGGKQAARQSQEIAAAGVNAADGSGRKVAEVNLGPGFEWLQEPLDKALKNPDLLLYKIQTNAYKFSWLLIPISVPFLWLLMLHRRRYRQYGAYDHTVFVTYSMSFMMLSLLAFTLLEKVVRSNDFSVMAFTIVAPVHMYRQLRGAYSLSRFSAIWRAIALGFFALIALVLFMIALVAIGALD